MKGKSVHDYALLHGLFFLYAVSSVLGKYAAANAPLSPSFNLFFLGSLAVMGAYSVLWQLILRRFSLTTAYSHRGIITVWGVGFGAALFGETLNTWTILACALILAGIILAGKQEP
jgi:drug/metabolite transporter (DMT)-like permease